MKATVQLNLANIKTLVEGAKEALKDTAYGIGDDVTASQTVPYRSGELEFTADIDLSEADNGHAAVTFNTPYARRLYFNPDNYQIRRTSNAFAQSMWLQTYVDGEKVNLPKEIFLKSWKEHSKGVIK